MGFDDRDFVGGGEGGGVESDSGVAGDDAATLMAAARVVGEGGR